MPRISLVVCVYKERDLLSRLLESAQDCYDDLVVVHDGREVAEASWKPGLPDSRLAIDWSLVPTKAPLPKYFAACQTAELPGSIREFVRLKGGRFFEHPKVGSLEGQSPFAWWAANYDWILRLDADEFPSDELKTWLKEFRKLPEIDSNISGYTCVWPHWSGSHQRTKNWPSGRIFLFNRKRIQFFGLIEQVPIPLGRYQETGLTLHHQPKRRSYGLQNILLRRQAYLWRAQIACSLLGNVNMLPRWNYHTERWPDVWERIRNNPLKEAFCHLFYIILGETKSMLRNEKSFNIFMVIGSGVHHFLFCIQFLLLKAKILK